MKKVVVVVRVVAGLRNKEAVFEGNDLEVIDTGMVSKLVIKRRDEKEAVAVFNSWVYYYREEDETLDKPDQT